MGVVPFGSSIASSAPWPLQATRLDASRVFYVGGGNLRYNSLSMIEMFGEPNVQVDR